MSEPTDADRATAAALLGDVHSGWCSAHPGHPDRFRGPCHCRLKGKADAIAAALATARAEGRDSVGLSDFMPDPCDEELRAPSEHIRAYYGSWLECTKRAGHDGDHEHETSGLTWSTR